MQLTDGRHLRHRDIVEHAQRADDDARQQQSSRVEVDAERVQEECVLVGQSGERSELDEGPRQHACQPQCCQRAQQGNVRGRAEPVREVERRERDHRRANDRDDNRVRTRQQSRQHESHENGDADCKAGQRTDTSPAPEGDDHDREQHCENPQRTGAFVVGEVVDGGAVRQSRRRENQVVANLGLLSLAGGDAQLKIRLFTIELTAHQLHRQHTALDQVTDGCSGAWLNRCSDHVPLDCRVDGVAVGRRIRRPQQNKANNCEHRPRRNRNPQ